MKTEGEKLFLKYKKQFIKDLGKKAMYDNQFQKILPWITGVYCHDNAIIKPGYYIINTDISTGPGLHWIGCYQTKKRCYLYDSFSRTPKFLLPLFVAKLEKKGVKIFQSDINDKEQYGQSEVCGQLCLSWLSVIKDLGIKKAMTI
jgi:hypothetical protein